MAATVVGLSLLRDARALMVLAARAQAPAGLAAELGDLSGQVPPSPNSADLARRLDEIANAMGAP